MNETNIVNGQSTVSNTLEGEVWNLFYQSVSSRYALGVHADLRRSAIRQFYNDDDRKTDVGFGDYEKQEGCDCECGEGEHCDLCTKPLDEVCSSDAYNEYKDYSPFSGVAALLTTTKKYEYISLAENYYAPVGNRPFKLKARKEPKLPTSEIKSAANEFYATLENFLDENQVRVDEIPNAFDVNILSDVSGQLVDVVQQDAKIRLQSSLTKNEDVLERVFKRANYMEEYLEVIKDTSDWPIGIMWCNDDTIKKQKIIKNGKLAIDIQIQSDAERIDPRYFWATEDYELNHTGRAVFTLKQFRNSDIKRLIDEKISGSSKINTNIKEYLENHPDGYTMYVATLFNDDPVLSSGKYDVLITRGWYDKNGVKEYGVKIADEYKLDDYVPVEIWFSGNKILKIKVMECADDTLGVYTTVFRRRGQSIFGYSLHDFIYPFAKLYEGAINNIDKSTGKSVGSIIAIDTAVIDDPEKYLQKDKNGNITLDLSADLLIEFDSNRAMSSNFKGIPIQVEQLPTDLAKLLPVVRLVFEQLESLTGIPSLLTNSGEIPSALRTDRNFTRAMRASSLTIRALLRESERRVLKPSIRYFFIARAQSGDMDGFLLEADPEILLSDKLIREEDEDRQLVQDVIELSQFSQLIPQEKIAALINNLGREVYGLESDLVPGVEPLDTQQPVQNVQTV